MCSNFPQNIKPSPPPSALPLIWGRSVVSVFFGGESQSRRGNHRLKNAMFLAAFASLRSPESKAFYDRKRAEGKKHNAAVVCLARRRCDVTLAMLRDGTTYQPAHQPTPLPEAA